MLNIGKLNDRIEIQTQTTGSADRFGVKSISYASASLWADATLVAGDTRDNAGYFGSDVSATFVVRSSANVKEGSFVIYKNRKYAVVFVSEPHEGVYKLATRLVI